MNQTMIIANKETKEFIQEFWYANPFTGISGFPVSISHTESCEMNTPILDKDGVEYTPTTCSCPKIEKECVSLFQDGTWRKAYDKLVLPATTDEEDDAEYDRILASYIVVVNDGGEKTVIEPILETPNPDESAETPPAPVLVVTTINITPITKNDCVVDVPYNIVLEILDQNGDVIVPDEIPSILSTKGLSAINELEITPIRKGVDVIRVMVGDVVKDLVVKIRGVEPYPDYILDENNGAYWVTLSVDDMISYIGSRVIEHPEFLKLKEERDYYKNELFVKTIAWADIAVRAASTKETLDHIDSYRLSLANMLNYINNELRAFTHQPSHKSRRRRSTPSSFMVIEKPIIPAPPEGIYQYL